MGEGADREISGRPPGLRRDSDPVEGAGAARRLGVGAGDPRGCRSPGHALRPRAGSRDLLHHVPPFTRGVEGPYTGLRNHALHAARFR